MLFDAKFFDDLSKKLSAALPKGVQDACHDVEKNFHTILKSALGKLDLVTREEFDAQKAVLLRTRKKVDAIEKQLGLKPATKPKASAAQKHSTAHKTSTAHKAPPKSKGHKGH